MFLINSRYPLFSATPLSSDREGLHLPGAYLLPKLRYQFAEFLNQSSLERLRILSSPTCVGFRYGRHMDSYAGLFSEAVHQSVDVLSSKWRAPLPLSVLTMRLWHEASYIANLRG